MNHLTEDQVYAAAFEDVVDAALMAHLDMCESCRVEYQSLRSLAQTFAISRRSQPSAAQIIQYEQMASLIQPKPSFFSGLMQQFQAALTQDSRQRLDLQGVRSGGGQQHYRLLYSAENVDIEFFVDALGSTRRIEGEVLPLPDSALHPPLYIEMYATHPNSDETVWTAESTQQGRFQLAGVSQGEYDLIITPSTGPSLRIEGINIS